MTAVLSASPSPTSSLRDARSPAPNPNLSALPPLNTSATQPARRSPLQRPPSYARNRISAYSASNAPPSLSRPQSTVFPFFHSSLPYALVRDFAYPIQHPNHYGPPPESQVQSGSSTPLSDIQRRLSEPTESTWEADSAPWSAGPWAGDGAQQLPQTTYGEGPPYSEDEDLHSPVVVSSSHKKHKSSSSSERGRRKWRSPGEEEDDDAEFADGRGYLARINGDGSETYYDAQAETGANGPGGELVTYPPDRGRQSFLEPHAYSAPSNQRDSHFAGTLSSRSYRDSEHEATESEHSPSSPQPDDPTSDSRYSKDYQFTIASPDEEMHGKAVALFDFTRENENELPLVEGQVIWVSYRQLQGWLVAQDPKTGESGLVPEEYVRLLRDIEGEWPSSIAAEMEKEPSQSPIASPTITTTAGSENGGEKRPPVVSTFSTSSKDLSPYPHRLPAGQTPPPVAHYGSQTNTPTGVSAPAGPLKRGSSRAQETVKEEDHEDDDEEEEEQTSDDDDDSD
ncbi:MAG: hypothetical protein Q9195_007433 [Heterodermia aff. obscurata]